MFTFVPDVGLPPLLFWLGIAGPLGLLLFGVVAGVEALVLKGLQWGTWGRVVLAALAMNICSTLVGLLVGQLPAELALVLLGVMFALSVLIEWGVLVAFKRGARTANLRAAFLANLASYSLLVLLLFFFSGRL